MIYRFVSMLLVVLSVHNSSFAGNRQAEVDAGQDGNRHGAAGAIITVGILSAAAAGTGAFFLIRRSRRERHHGDSIIALVEQAWDSAAVLYASEKYRSAVMQLQKITERWYDYENYSRRYRKRRHVDPDSIRVVIASCDFLEGMIEPIKVLSTRAERLPLDEFGLSKISRQQIAGIKHSLRHEMDSILTLHSNHRSGLTYSFRHIEERILKADSLLEALYPRQKKNFTIKNRFHYNRAMESSDTVALRRFVEDCDYYQVDKEWCQRARLAMQGAQAVGEAPPAFANRNMSRTEVIHAEYRRAMQSKRIEVLETYMKKYSDRKYRRYRREAKLDSVRVALRLLRRKINEEIAFNKAFPRFGSGQVNTITLNSKGLSGATEDAFKATWYNLRQETAKLPSIRLPASLTIDYTRQPPMIMLDAVISPEHDIEKTPVKRGTTYRVSCLVPAMNLLHRYKLLTVTLLKEGKEFKEGLDGVIDFQMTKVSQATYILRLRKPEQSGALLFYAKESSEADVDTSRKFQFYDFYEIVMKDGENRRFPIYPGSLPSITPSLSANPAEKEAGRQFFGEEAVTQRQE